MNRLDPDAHFAIAKEAYDNRVAAHKKHGDNSIEAIEPDSPRWMPILMEEVGEAAHELTYDAKDGSLRSELLDTITVAIAWVAAIDGEG